MTKPLALLIVLLNCCAGPSPSTSSDASLLKEILRLANEDPQDNLRSRLEAIASTLRDPEVLAKVSSALDEIVGAAALHRRVAELDRDVTALGGLVKVEPGGPAWMRTLAGDQAMKLYDRLVVVSMNDKTNPHFKDYKLNPKVNDAWVDRLRGFPDLRSLDLANMDVRGPGLVSVGKLPLESLNLTLTPVTDESLSSLAGLTGLKVLGLASTKVTGTGMEKLGGLRKLENLNFHSCPVTDAGLGRIGKLFSLIRLEIVHTQFTDAGTGALSGLVTLERLQLGSRKATGASLAFLRDLPRLRELDVHDGMLTAEGFRHVGSVGTLRVLRAYGGSAGDEGVRSLGSLAELETLVLEGVGITDSAIDTLSKLPRLRKLTLREPKVSEAGAARLRAALPAIEISR